MWKPWPNNALDRSAEQLRFARCPVSRRASRAGAHSPLVTDVCAAALRAFFSAAQRGG